ncbi:MAG: hypothetical protein PF442_07410 [Desulfobulbaceae bacterium]|jgi:hypothetical protein|nr:hypothetical protein [Desulfobulbaceae bacterium]
MANPPTFHDRYQQGDTPWEQGPPHLSAQQITAVVEPLFSIESLTASFFDSDQAPQAKN